MVRSGIDMECICADMNRCGIDVGCLPFVMETVRALNYSMSTRYGMYIKRYRFDWEFIDFEIKSI